MRPFRPYHAYTAYHLEPGGLRRLEFFVQRIEEWSRRHPSAAVRILDIGCGNGNISLPLAGIGYDVTGVDLDADAILHAERSAVGLRLSHARFVVGSFDAVGERRFDIIIASEVLEHQRSPSAFLAAVSRRLTPEGILLLSVPNGKSLEERIRKFTTHTSIGLRLKMWIKKYIGHQSVQTMALHPHEQFLSLQQWRRLLKKNGWRIHGIRQAAAFFKEFFYLIGRLFIRRGSPWFHRLDAADDSLAGRLPFVMSDGWLIEVQRSDADHPLVMHILPSLASGGAERFVYDVCSRLPERGFEAHVVSILRGGPLEPLFHDRVPFTVLDRRGLFGLSAVRSLVRLMREMRPDVVHTHLFGADVWGRIAAKIAGVPVIISTEHNVNTEHGAIKRFIKGMLSLITDRFIAPAEVVKQNMIGREYIPAKMIAVIPNGIDMSRVMLRPPRGFGDVPHLITVGRLAPQKGQAILLKALAMVKGPWTLDIIGSGPLEADLRKLADRLSITPRIRWMGFCDDVPQRLAASDLFLFPSLWEGFGLAVLEAASAGVPCIASDLPVFHEFLSSNDAIFVEPGDVPSLAHAIRETLRDPYSLIARAQAAGERLRSACSIDVTVAAYADLYRSCLDSYEDPAHQ